MDQVTWTRYVLMMTSLMVLTLAAAPVTDSPGRGISEALARERAAIISDARYELHLTIPENRRDPVEGRVTVRFMLARPQRIVFDFAQPRDRVRAATIGGRDANATFVDGHIIIPAERSVAGRNEVVFDFIAGDDALNRSDDFLYSLFVPARAQFTFPCFDQPDVKARYTLTMDVPREWQAISNARELTRTPVTKDDGAIANTTRVAFAETQPLPTYLFAFTAGRFSMERAVRDGRELRMFHRETDASKVARNREAIFDLHATALRWLESYTAIEYPFDKLDFILIPSFQFGGMEHAGAILYRESSLLLDRAATQNQLIGRATLIAHETSHMWFGDLVTMEWFNDVWMKEVFANFMAAKIANPSFPDVNHELRFLLTHYPAAYQVDRTAGANPIRQPLGNLNDAGQLYGDIIYQKAPIVMRQLEMIVGEQGLRDGLRAYLTRHAFANASWPDLIRVLDPRTPQDLAAWSRAWVEERGRPTFMTDVRVDARGRLRGITLTVDDPQQRGLVWPQQLQVALGYDGTVRHASVAMSRRTTTVRGASGLARPLYVLPNGAGLGYGLFLLDEESRTYLLGHIEDIPDTLTRGSAWVTLWDNMLEMRVTARDFLDTAARALPLERDEQNVQRVLGYATRTYWKYLAPEQRTERAATLEAMLRRGLERAATQSQKAAWFNAFRTVVITRDGLNWLERVWRREETIPGLPFAEADEMTLALELAVREVPAWQEILRTQLERIENPDRRAQFAFVMPALSADAATREAAFARLRQPENRRREPWVAESLRYLNHPLREAHARRFVRPALELLREIQQTGDIFFPINWLDATFAGHRSPEAAVAVQEFLAEELLFPERLRWTILNTADELFRAAARE